MYASVRRYKMDPSSVDEVKRQVSDGFLPIVSKVPGFAAYYVVNGGDGVVVSISVFQDQSGAEESYRRSAGWVRDNIASLVPNPPEITEGDVIVHGSAYRDSPFLGAPS